MSVDVPLFPAEWLEKLVQAYDSSVTMLSHGDEMEPLLAVYDTALTARAEELILSGDRSVRSLFAGSKVNRLEYTGDPDFLLNCNTPEDFEKAKTLYRRVN